MNRLQELAIELHRHGHTVIRLEPFSKAPKWTGWQTYEPTEDRLLRDFARESNIGVRMGDLRADGTSPFTVDVDLENGELIRCVECALGEGVPVKQGKKGASFIGRMFGEVKTQKIQWTDRETGKKVAAIDVLGRGTQTVIPPSNHPETKLPYRWIAGSPLETLDYPLLPVFSWTTLDEIKGFCANPDDPIFKLNDMTWHGVGGGGDTHDICVAAVASMVARKWEDDDIHQRVKRAKREACEAAGMPYDWPAAHKTIQEWIDSARRKDFDAKSTPRKAISHGLLADQFLSEMRPQIRYDWKRQSMAMFTGNRWAHDQDPAVRYEIERFLQGQMRNRSWIEGVFKSLRDRPEVAVYEDVWDQDPNLLNTPGGTVNLVTGVMRPSDPADLITRSTAVAPDFDFAGSLWCKVLIDWIGDSPEELAYIQRLAGYMLSGETKEQMLSLLVGPGLDGKSTFSDNLALIMNDYAAVATDTVFLGSRFRQHSEELAMLKGARLVQLSEMSGYWDENRIKQVTGGDAVTAAFKNGHNFTFRPNFKLLVTSNDPPRLTSVGRAIRRRFHVYPFQNQIKNVDHDLDRRLKAEWRKILGWAIMGAVDYHQNGLQRSPAVIAASDEYFLESDFAQQFMDERCDLGPDLRARASDVYLIFKTYMEEIGRYRVPDRPTLIKALESKGIIAKRAVVEKGKDPEHALIGLKLRQEPVKIDDTKF